MGNVSIDRECLVMDHEQMFQFDGEELDPAIAAILLQLWAAARDPAARPWSLAKLGKRSKIAMSTLLRNLAPLEDAGLVEVVIQDDGREVAALTVSGLEVCAGLFASGEQPSADQPDPSLH
jgi:DNA-binding MarR family transcriptional regulator